MDDYLTAHCRFGHYNYKNLSELVQSGVHTGLNLDPKIVSRCCTACNCSVCELAKMRKPGPFKKNDTKKRRESLQNFQYMVSDVQGPFPVSRDGYRYCVHFTCVKSGWSFVHFMTKRDDISSCWRVTISDIKKFCHGRHADYLNELHYVQTMLASMLEDS